MCKPEVLEEGAAAEVGGVELRVVCKATSSAEPPITSVGESKGPKTEPQEAGERWRRGG